ncbi:helix-turn-helix transcriptional regulator [Streptomyces sp. NPDC003077]|uniref:helix-turn-helix domain-containing protein n=1 Tax=Streptomyces sp. NPDC003077 TaxID=3154443 RepID=UPI0033A94337
MVIRQDMRPQRPRDIAEFVARMKHLKVHAGVTFRELERRAAERGDVLARSTLADVLRRRTLPRAEVLAAYVRACGCDEDETREWLTERKRLAEGGERGEGDERGVSGEESVSEVSASAAGVPAPAGNGGNGGGGGNGSGAGVSGEGGRVEAAVGGHSDAADTADAADAAGAREVVSPADESAHGATSAAGAVSSVAGAASSVRAGAAGEPSGAAHEQARSYEQAEPYDTLRGHGGSEAGGDDGDDGADGEGTPGASSDGDAARTAPTGSPDEQKPSLAPTSAMPSAPPAQRPRGARRALLLGGGTAAVLLLSVGGWLLTGGPSAPDGHRVAASPGATATGPSSPTTPTHSSRKDTARPTYAVALPQAGVTRIRAATDPGLCLSQREVGDHDGRKIVAALRPCPVAVPPTTSLVKAGPDSYLIQWRHPEESGPGCLTALGPGDGRLLEPYPEQDCERHGPPQRYRFEPVTDGGASGEGGGTSGGDGGTSRGGGSTSGTSERDRGAPGKDGERAYRLRSGSGDQCVGLTGAGRADEGADAAAPGALLRVEPCTSAADQRFLVGPG